MPFLDGRMGLGVAGEAKWFAERNWPVFVFIRRQVSSPENLCAFEADPASGLFSIRPMDPKERLWLRASDPCLVVPHIETRLRTWIVYNKTMRPYAEAHLARMPLPDGFYPAEG